MKRRRAILGWIAIGALLLAAAWWIVDGAAWHMETTARRMIGQPEAQLIAKLGPPRHVVTAATLAGRTVDYPWKGMNFVPVPNRPVTNRVLLYSHLNIAIYVYVNASGLVDYVEKAGT